MKRFSTEKDANISISLLLGELLYRKKISMDRLRPDAFNVIRSGDFVEVDAARSRVHSPTLHD